MSSMWYCFKISLGFAVYWKIKSNLQRAVNVFYHRLYILTWRNTGCTQELPCVVLFQARSQSGKPGFTGCRGFSRPTRILRRGEVLNEKWRKQVQQNYFEKLFCLSCTFIFRNERNWMKKSARVSEKLVSPSLPGLQVATRLCFD